MGSQSESHRSKTIEMSNLLSFVSIAINIGCDSKYLLHLIIMFFCTSKVSILLTYHHYINKWKAKHTFVKSGPSSAKHLTNNHLAFKSWLTYNYFHQSFIQCFLSLFKVTSRGQRNSFLPKSVSPIFFFAFASSCFLISLTFSWPMLSHSQVYLIKCVNNYNLSLLWHRPVVCDDNSLSISLKNLLRHFYFIKSCAKNCSCINN